MVSKQELDKCSIWPIGFSKFKELPFYDNIFNDLLEEDYTKDEVEEMLQNAEFVYLPEFVIIKYSNNILDYYQVLGDNTVIHQACDTSLEV